MYGENYMAMEWQENWAKASLSSLFRCLYVCIHFVIVEVEMLGVFQNPNFYSHSIGM